MNLNEVIFIDNLPTLDLHGVDRETARVMIDDFIKDNYVMKNNIIVIVHGIGSGILKTTTQNTLSKNKKVIEYKVFPFNVGCTIVRIDLTN